MGKTFNNASAEKVTDLDFVRGLLVMNKITSRSLGRSINVSCSYVSQVLHGHRNSRKVLQAVADALGMAYEELWADKQ
jgi:transcriptional regulator with XRE-family HTH domain